VGRIVAQSLRHPGEGVRRQEPFRLLRAMSLPELTEMSFLPSSQRMSPDCPMCKKFLKARTGARHAAARRANGSHMAVAGTKAAYAAGALYVACRARLVAPSCYRYVAHVTNRKARRSRRTKRNCAREQVRGGKVQKIQRTAHGQVGAAALCHARAYATYAACVRACRQKMAKRQPRSVCGGGVR